MPLRPKKDVTTAGRSTVRGSPGARVFLNFLPRVTRLRWVRSFHREHERSPGTAAAYLSYRVFSILVRVSTLLVSLFALRK